MPRDRKDRVEWLVERRRYEEALTEAGKIETEERMAVVKAEDKAEDDEKSKVHLSVQEIGQKYIKHLVNEGASCNQLYISSICSFSTIRQFR